jgi:hypothetical protein
MIKLSKWEELAYDEKEGDCRGWWSTFRMK